MPLINQRARVETGGLYRLGQALEDLGKSIRSENEREALGSFAGDLFERPHTEGEARLIEDAPETAFRYGARRQERQETLSSQERRERSARVERELAASRGRAETLANQKALAGYKATLKGQDRKGPTQSQLDRKARATEIGQVLSPMAGDDPTVATMLDLAKAVRRGEDRLPEYRAAVEAALGPKLRRKAELEMKARDYSLGPGEDQELLDLDRITESMLRDSLEYGETVAARRGRGRSPEALSKQAFSAQPQAAQGSAPPRAPLEENAPAGGGGMMSDPALGMAPEEARGPEKQGPPDRFDEIAFEIESSGADVAGIMSGLQRRSPDVLAALGIDERDADALYAKLGDAVMGGQEEPVQERAAAVKGMPRTAMGGIFGAGVAGSNIVRGLMGEIGSRVRMPGGGRLSAPSAATDPLEERAMGEITAQQVREGVGNVAGGLGRGVGEIGATLGRGAREAASLAPDAGAAAIEGALGTAAIPPQMLVSLLDALGQMQGMEGQFAQAPGMAQRSLAQVLGPPEGQPGAGLDMAIADLFAEPGQAMQAEPGENVFGQAAPGGGVDLNMIQAFLDQERQRHDLEQILRMLDSIPQ